MGDCGCPEGVFCKHRQLKGFRSGMGQKKSRQIDSPADENRLIKKDVKHNKDRATAQEYAVRDDYREVGYTKARKVPGSGAYHEAQLLSDVEVESLLLVECKESRTGKLQIEPEWIDKVRAESKLVGKRWWAIHGWVAADEGNYRKTVLVDQDTWLDLMKELKDLNEENKFIRSELDGR